MNDRPKLCKQIELASFYFEDGAVEKSIDILTQCLKDLKDIKKKRDIFYKKMSKDI